MLKIFLVFYTASGGIASVSRDFGEVREMTVGSDMEYCEQLADERNASNLEHAKTDAEIFVAECEQHKSPPKVTVKIDAKTRKTLEVSCIARGLPMQCSDLPNGDLEIMTSARDSDGSRIHVITKPDGSSVTGTYDSKNKFHIREMHDKNGKLIARRGKSLEFNPPK